MDKNIFEEERTKRKFRTMAFILLTSIVITIIILASKL